MPEGWGRLNNREVLEAFAGIEVDRLKRLLEAVSEWKRIVQSKLDSSVEEAKDRYGELPEWVGERFGDEAYLLQETKRVLCAGISVAIASVTEAFCASVCHFKNPNRPLKGKKGRRISWGRLKQGLEADLGAKLDTLAGYAGTRQARSLSNCFKHRRGRADAELTAETGIAEGSDVEFEKEDWQQMIQNTKEFLFALAAYV